MTKDNVIDFNGITRLDLDPNKILEAAKNCLSEVIVLGYTKTGEEYFASSTSSGEGMLWHLERTKKKLLEMAD